MKKTSTKLTLIAMLCGGVAILTIISNLKNETRSNEITSDLLKQAKAPEQKIIAVTPHVVTAIDRRGSIPSIRGTSSGNIENQSDSAPSKDSYQTAEVNSGDIYENPPEEKLPIGATSPESIFAPSKFSPDQIKEKFEASISRLDLVAKAVKPDSLECTEINCKFEVIEKLPAEAQQQLYDYYLSHPQYGAWIDVEKSKDDPTRITYTLTDKKPEGAL